MLLCFVQSQKTNFLCKCCYFQRVQKKSLHGWEKALLLLFSLAAEHFCHSLGLETLSTVLVRWEQELVADWRKQPLTHWDACPGGRVKQSAVRGVHGTRLALKGGKSFTVCCSPIEVKWWPLDDHTADLMVLRAMASPLFTMSWLLELTLKKT